MEFATNEGRNCVQRERKKTSMGETASMSYTVASGETVMKALSGIARGWQAIIGSSPIQRKRLLSPAGKAVCRYRHRLHDHTLEAAWNAHAASSPVCAVDFSYICGIIVLCLSDKSVFGGRSTEDAGGLLC